MGARIDTPVRRSGVSSVLPPPAPTITGAAGRNTYLTVAWTPPALAAGQPPITGYRVFAYSDPNGAPVASAAAPAPAPPAPAAAAAPAPAAAAASAAAPAASGGIVEVLVPDIGDFDSVAVIEVMVKVGDTIKVEQSLITVESDKASMEIPSSHAGVIKAVKVALGDKVSKGSLVALVEVAGAVAATAAPAPAAAAAVPAGPAPAPSPAAAAAAAAPVAAVAAVPAHDPTAAKGALPHASPSIRRLARELGVPLAEVKEIAAGGGFGSIMGRNAFQRSRDDGLALLREVMRIYKDIGSAA